jgi:hypothetical protein
LDEQRATTEGCCVNEVRDPPLRETQLKILCPRQRQVRFRRGFPHTPHRLKGRLRSPRSTQVLSTRSLGLLNFSLVRSVSRLSPSTPHTVISARCPILPGGIVIGNQVEGGRR